MVRRNKPVSIQCHNMSENRIQNTFGEKNLKFDSIFRTNSKLQNKMTMPNEFFMLPTTKLISYQTRKYQCSGLTIMSVFPLSWFGDI